MSRRQWGLILLIVAVLALALGLLLRGVLPEAEDPTWDRILETGVLPVCTDPSWPPFEYVAAADEGSGNPRIVGFDADLAHELARRLAPGVRAELVTVGFDSLYDALAAGRCDAVLSALPYEAERTEDVAYSLSYFNAGLVLVTRQETVDVEALADLEGRVVGVEWGFVPEGDVRQKEFLRNLKTRRYDTAGETLRALGAGEVEAALVDRISALGYMRDCRGLRIVGEPLHDVNYVIPTRPDSFRLRDAIDSVLIEMREDGTLEELQEKWF